MPREASKMFKSTGRRTFVRRSGMALVAGLFGHAAPIAGKSQAPERVGLTKAVRDAATPEQIIERAKAGNRRYLTGTQVQRDFLAEQKATAAGQYPAAVVLGCIDSRAPAEIVFDLGIGDIFNCRVAGNIENPDILGSMEFATHLSGAKVVLVLGHSGCGAIKGAISDAKLGSLTQLLTKIKPAIAATTYNGDRSADNAAFVNAVARKNVELTMANIRRNSPVMAELEKSGRLKVVGAFQDLATGAVDFFA